MAPRPLTCPLPVPADPSTLRPDPRSGPTDHSQPPIPRTWVTRLVGDYGAADGGGGASRGDPGAGGRPRCGGHQVACTCCALRRPARADPEVRGRFRVACRRVHAPLGGRRAGDRAPHVGGDRSTAGSPSQRLPRRAPGESLRRVPADGGRRGPRAARAVRCPRRDLERRALVQPAVVPATVGDAGCTTSTGPCGTSRCRGRWRRSDGAVEARVAPVLYRRGRGGDAVAVDPRRAVGARLPARTGDGGRQRRRRLLPPERRPPRRRSGRAAGDRGRPAGSREALRAGPGSGRRRPPPSAGPPRCVSSATAQSAPSWRPGSPSTGRGTG